MSDKQQNISQCENPEHMVEIFPCDISSVTDTTKTFCYEVNTKDFRFPFDSLEVFRSVQKYFLRIIEDLINYVKISSKFKYNLNNTEFLNNGSEKQIQIALCHCDRIMEAGCFKDLIAYSDLFRQCISSSSLPSSLNDKTLIKLYLEKLEQFLELKHDFVDLRSYYQCELDEASKNCNKFSISKTTTMEGLSDLNKNNTFNNSENMRIQDNDFSMLIYATSWETSDRKKKLLHIMRTLRKIVPGWSETKSSFQYHCNKIMSISDLNSIEMQNYRAILTDLEENAIYWRSNDVLNTLSDLDYLRKLSNPNFTIRPKHELLKELYHDLRKSCDEFLIDENLKINKNIPDILSESISYISKKNIGSPLQSHRSHIKKPSRTKLAEKSSMSESYAKQAAKLPRVTGVFYGKSCFSWVAQIPVKKGHTKQLYFSVKKYGFSDARLKAIEARESHTNCLGRDDIAVQHLNVYNKELSTNFDFQQNWNQKQENNQNNLGFDFKSSDTYRSNQRGLRSQSFASQARASPQIPGVNYDSKRACWMVKGSLGGNTHKQFHIRKYGGFEAARSEAIQYLAKLNSPSAIINEQEINSPFQIQRENNNELRSALDGSPSTKQIQENIDRSINFSIDLNYNYDTKNSKDETNFSNIIENNQNKKQCQFFETRNYEVDNSFETFNNHREHEFNQKEIIGYNDFVGHLYHTRLSNVSTII